MPNIIDANGLQVASREELVTYFENEFKSIYGTDINLGSDTPDGEIIGIMVQCILDLEDLLVQIYSGFSPDNAIGRTLDQRVAINGIQRKAGTYSITPVTVVTNQACNLYGLDQSAQPIYTVMDDSGTKWLLLETESIGGAGTQVLSFRAENPGEVLTTLNTITVPDTIVLGVASVNNPTVQTVVGLNEETDAELKLRRARSVSLASQGYLSGLIAELENLNGMDSVFVYENVTGSTDGDGIPSHSIWVIVSGTAEQADIANAIYTKRNAGCGMKGDITYSVTQVDDSQFIVRWDTVQTQNVFIFFSLTSIDGSTPTKTQEIRDTLPDTLVPTVYGKVNINELASLIQDIDSNSLVTNSGFSTGQDQTLNLSDVPASGDFKIVYNGEASSVINWNDSIGTIETAVQALTGLASISVTGSLATKSLVFDLSSVSSVQSLLTVSDNTLLDAGAGAITFSLDADIQNTLQPTNKNQQFRVDDDNIIITPVQFLPSSATVIAGQDRQFEAHGGYGSYTYSILVDNSGGASIDSSGLYTAGPYAGVDTVQVMDTLGHTTTSTVTVI